MQHDKPRASVCVLSPRNNALVQYFDNSGISGNKGGTKQTLIQNVNSEYKLKMQNLVKQDLVANINEHTNNIEKQYNNHAKQIIANYWSDYIDFVNGLKLIKPIKQDLKPIGTLSIPQTKNIKKCVENLIAMITMTYKKSLAPQNQKFASFVTLTLPSLQVHSDKLIRKCLTRFIENLQKTYNVQHYVWRAETQSNGNIHFHLIVDMWVCHKTIRTLWNKQIAKLGYIQQYAIKRKKEGFAYRPYYFYKGKNHASKKTKQEQFAAYLKEKATGFVNPNTTDIHSLKNVKNAVNYLLKYLTKPEPDKRPVIGALWGCANITKRLEYPRFYETEVSFDELNHLLNSKKLKCVLKDDFFSVYVGKVYEVIRKNYSNCWQKMKQHYKTLLSYTKENYKQFENDYKEFKESLKAKVVTAPVVPKVKVVAPFQYDINLNLSPVIKFNSSSGIKKLSSYLSNKSNEMKPKKPPC